MARTTPVSNGWMVLVRPLAMILPGAEATMSILPNAAQPSARQKRAMIVTPIARPVGEGGVSTISSAAGRKASSSRSRWTAFGNGMTAALAGFMDHTPLQATQARITAAGSNQLVVGAILDKPAAVDGDDAVGHAHGGEPVRDDEHRAPFGDLAHVLLNDALALVVERARCLVEDQDARVADQGARNGDALALAARERRSALADDGVI